jgi:hypothetical protein
MLPNGNVVGGDDPGPIKPPTPESKPPLVFSGEISPKFPDGLFSRLEGDNVRINEMGCGGQMYQLADGSPVVFTAKHCLNIPSLVTNNTPLTTSKGAQGNGLKPAGTYDFVTYGDTSDMAVLHNGNLTKGDLAALRSTLYDSSSLAVGDKLYAVARPVQPDGTAELTGLSGTIVGTNQTNFNTGITTPDSIAILMRPNSAGAVCSGGSSGANFSKLGNGVTPLSATVMSGSFVYNDNPNSKQEAAAFNSQFGINMQPGDALCFSSPIRTADLGKTVRIAQPIIKF